MPMDRTLFNLWVDEPPGGDGSTGTKLTKARLDSDILDPIDAAIAAAGVAGATTQVMFNDAGVIAGDAGLTYNKTTDALTVGSLVPTLGQIVFPATQNASTGVNTLDDYEEGTFTAVIGGSGGQSGQTYSAQSCTYTKIGKLVHCYGYVALSAKGTITGNVQIQGLPFAAATYSVAVINWQGLATNQVNVVGRLDSSASLIAVFGIGTAATTSETNLVTADIGNSTAFMFSITYTAAS